MMNYAIEVNKLSKNYAHHAALSEISFKVKKGSIHGFLGPNGAGKSTTMKILTGLVPASSGSFQVSGEIGFLPEYPPLYGNMTVDDYLEFVLAIQKISNSKKYILDVKDQTGLNSVGDRYIGNLSKGFQQRVGIAQAIIHSPEIIILDEPTVGLDPVAVLEIRDLIRSLQDTHTILFSSHQLHEVEVICSDITLINQGKVLVSGLLSDIQKKFTTQINYKAKIAHFSEKIRLQMLEEFNLQSISVHQNYLDIFPKISEQGNEHRMRLTRFLSSEEIGLLEFSEERLDLEELFKRMTLEVTG